MNQFLDNLYHFFTNPYTWVVAGLIVFVIFLWRMGFFLFMKNNTFDCLMDHSTGRYTINNLSRWLLAYTVPIWIISSNLTVHITPEFQVIMKEPSEALVAICFAYIAGATWINNRTTPKENPPIDNAPINTESSREM